MTSFAGTKTRPSSRPPMATTGETTLSFSTSSTEGHFPVAWLVIILVFVFVLLFAVTAFLVKWLLGMYVLEILLSLYRHSYMCRTLGMLTLCNNYTKRRNRRSNTIKVGRVAPRCWFSTDSSQDIVILSICEMGNWHNYHSPLFAFCMFVKTILLCFFVLVGVWASVYVT